MEGAFKVHTDRYGSCTMGVSSEPSNILIEILTSAEY